ncbi:hypothetical protein B9Z65_3516 [Elsinoe australis]|uniref:Uncharacterized protein n=1 Tax=Elsinoe australis TaxID=40998 RepID=A0A2P8AFF8_9PEZI|nr:hypothetical protein B9Z65_3516 [Elsinoe australis]
MPRKLSFLSSPKKEEQKRERKRQELKRSISSPLETGFEHLVDSDNLQGVGEPGALPSPPDRPSLSPAAAASSVVQLGVITATLSLDRPELSRLITAPGALEAEGISPIIPASGPLSSQASARAGSSSRRPSIPPHPDQVGLPSAPNAYLHASHSRSGSVQVPTQSEAAEADPSSQTRARSIADARQAHDMMAALHRQKIEQLDRDVEEWNRIMRNEPRANPEDFFASEEERIRRYSELQQAEMLRDAEIEAWKRRVAERERELELQGEYVLSLLHEKKTVRARDYPDGHLLVQDPDIMSVLDERSSIAEKSLTSARPVSAVSASGVSTHTMWPTVNDEIDYSFDDWPVPPSSSALPERPAAVYRGTTEPAGSSASSWLAGNAASLPPPSETPGAEEKVRGKRKLTAKELARLTPEEHRRLYEEQNPGRPSADAFDFRS